MPHRGPFLIERDGVRWVGTHLIVDLGGASRLDDPGHVEATLRACADACGATVLQVHAHHFGPGDGCTGVALLAESHISIHTWPEHGYAAVDVFVCGEREPRRVVGVLEAAFTPRELNVTELRRGHGHV